MEEVLLTVGSIVKSTPPRSDQQEWLIIGQRCINPDSMKAWDYVAVPREKGFKWFITPEKKFEVDFYYFNHTDIDEIVFQQPEYVRDEG